MTTLPSDEVCIRGCLARHFAECPSYGVDGGSCTGCAPSKAYNATLVCETCYRRVRGILRNAPDLVGRLRTLIAQGKAVAYSHAKVPGRSSAAPVMIDSELLDALNEITANLTSWYRLIDRRSLAGLDAVLADPAQIDRLWAATLDVHPVDDEGDRHAWSLADAAARWGIERRDRHVHPWVDAGEEVDIVVAPVTEYGNPLLVSKDAARRAGVSESQLRRWVRAGVLAPTARLRQPDGIVTRWFRASEVDTAKQVMLARRHSGGVSKPE